MPTIALDPTTLLFATSLLGFLSAGLSLHLSKAMGERRSGLLEWSKSMLCVGISFLLFFFRGQGPALLTFMLANAVVMGIPVYALFAYARFSGIEPARRAVGLLYAVGLSGALAHYFLDAPRDLAVVTLSTSIALIFAMATALIIRRRTARSAIAPAWRFAAATMAVPGVTFGMRAVYTLAGEGSSVSLSAHASPQIAALATGILAIVAASIGFMMMVCDRQSREVLEGSRRDDLTGLHTRAALFEQMARLDTKSTGPYALIMLDIDHFKGINDGHGHTSGDIVLAHAGRLILQSIRSVDFAGRYGGEEFCVLLRGCGQLEARHFAERLVVDARLQSVRLPNGAQAHFRFSAGYASRWVPAVPGESAEPIVKVLERADAALYQAKRAGRNRAVGAPDPGAHSRGLSPPSIPLHAAAD